MSETAGIATPETGPGVTYQGCIAIEWPQPGHRARPLNGWDIAVFDALNGKQILTVTRIELHASANDVVSADVTMFANGRGEPVYTGPPLTRNGEVIYGTFPFLVAEMRVRPAEPDRGALAAKFLAEPCAS